MAGALTYEGQARVVDGDTLDVAGQRIRLFGIDAPERRQTCDRNGQIWACGDWARSALARQVQGSTVTCDVQDHDRYGRAVAICRVGSQDLGESLVGAGAARAYLRYSDRYAGTEAVAAAAGYGIWATRMVTPEAYRHKGAESVQPAAVQGNCQIKGNISANGRIYHQPGQRDYGATRINTAKGEAYFCTVAEAKAAGFRPAVR